MIKNSEGYRGKCFRHGDSAHSTVRAIDGHLPVIDLHYEPA